MKNIFLILITLIKPFCTDAAFYEVDVSESVINFSSFCKEGRITVFIMAQHGCPPCITAKNYFLDNYANNKIMDIYYCMRTKSMADLKYFKDRPSTLMWGYIEAYTTSPRIYIFGPTGNPQGVYNGFNGEKISLVLDGLLQYLDFYNRNLLTYNSNVDVDSNKNIQENKVLSSLLVKCKNDVDKLINEKEQLIVDLNRFKGINEMLENYKEELKKENTDCLEKQDTLYVSLQHLKDSVNELRNQNEAFMQKFANYWYSLAKDFEEQIETRRFNRSTKAFIINQITIFYEKSLENEKNCIVEYEVFKNKYDSIINK